MVDSSAAKQSKSCVVYVMNSSELLGTAEFSQGAAAAAQHSAIEMELPLAVIASAVLGDHKKLASLKDLEHQLAVLNIPIIAMIGSETQVLAAVKLHLRPAVIVTAARGGSGKLAAHPHSWPSAVLPVAEVAARQNAC